MDFNEAFALQKAGKKPVTKLKNLSVTRVDLVDKGANPYAHVMITKAADDPEQSHEAQPAVMDIQKVQAVIGEFVRVGATVSDAACIVMKHQPQLYEDYRKANFR